MPRWKSGRPNTKMERLKLQKPPLKSENKVGKALFKVLTFKLNMPVCKIKSIKLSGHNTHHFTYTIWFHTCILDIRYNYVWLIWM